MEKKDKIIFLRMFEVIMDYMFIIARQPSDESIYKNYKHLEDDIVKWIKEE